LGASDTNSLLTVLTEYYPHCPISGTCTIGYLDGGISICESHVFQERAEIVECSINGEINSSPSEQWSVMETEIRNVLSLCETPEEKIPKEATLFT